VTTRRYTIEPRGLASARVRLMVPLMSVLAALLVGAGFLAMTGNSPWEVYSRMVDTAFGSGRGLAETLVSATPLILTGVAAAVAFKMLVWNIGGEGQLLMGAIAAAGIGILMGDGVPAAVALPVVVLAGAAGGAFWASLAAVPRVYLGTNEIITTLMLNFIALNLMNYLVLGSYSPWRDPASTQFPQGRPIPEAARLPEFFYRLDYGLFIAIGVAILAWALIGRTRWGFELRIVGDSSDTARYAGIGVPRKVLGVFLLSGAAAGLAGSLLVAGILGKMDPRSLDLGLGFTGIIVAALARLNPLAVIPVGVLMGALNNAGPALQSIQVPSATVTMLQGAILIFAVSGEFLIANRIRNVRKEEVPGLPPGEAAAT
jgi:simple sugar transport system permease protein